MKFEAKKGLTISGLEAPSFLLGTQKAHKHKHYMGISLSYCASL